MGQVYVYGLSNMEAQQWRSGCEEDKGIIVDPYADAKLIVLCVRNEQGERLFTEKHIMQIVQLPELVVKGLVGLATRLCGFGYDAEAKILKNYAATVVSS